MVHGDHVFLYAIVLRIVVNEDLYSERGKLPGLEQRAGRGRAAVRSMESWKRGLDFLGMHLSLNIS